MSENKHIGDYIGNSHSFKEERSVPGLVSSSNYVGIEVEIENVKYSFHSDGPRAPRLNYFEWRDDGLTLPELGKHWYIVKDNSLRQGSEFIFNNPKRGKQIIEALNSLNQFLSVYRQYGKGPEVSDRCSIHCHLDVRDLTEQQLSTLLMVYILFERVLFAYVDPSRLKNNYCRPITDSSFKQVLATIKENSSPDKFSSVLEVVKSSCDKYSALNLLPLRSFGTVEFRHHQGTTSMNEEVLDWINIILSIKLAASLSIEELLYTYEDCGYRRLMELVFEGTKLASPDFLDKFEIDSLVSKGIIDVIEIFNFSKLLAIRDKPVIRNSVDILASFKSFNKIAKPKVIKEPSKTPIKPKVEVNPIGDIVFAQPITAPMTWINITPSMMNDIFEPTDTLENN